MIHPSLFLRRALLADAIFSGGSAVGLTLGAGMLASLLNLPEALLREVGSDTLAVALRGAEPEVQEKILKNMSKRAAEILKDDMEARGPVKLTDVEAAQKEIIVIAQRMAEEGTISLGGKGAGEFV